MPEQVRNYFGPMKKWMQYLHEYLPWFVDFWYYIMMIVLFIVLAVIYL